MNDPDYEKRIQQQIEQYRHVENMHELPEIFHYWSNKYLLPRMQAVLEISSVTEFYVEHFRRAAAKHGGPYCFASLGAGDCALEIEIAKSLRAGGLSEFHFDCLELSPVLLARAEEAAKSQNLGDCLRLIAGDLNHWSPSQQTYTGIMANHSLHHMVELEAIFSNTRSALRLDGVFVTNDMIGRNGHMRWPETAKMVEQIWRFLPDRCKFNRQLSTFDGEFVDRDCSIDGFEGIRAQDILPLLVKQFGFSYFLAYGGLMDVFIDRGYGHNFDVHEKRDLAFIDFVSELNDLCLEHGVTKPTMMFAVMSPGPVEKPKFFRNLTPEFSVRRS
jgi:SAM-dependent methyltransferase